MWTMSAPTMPYAPTPTPKQKKRWPFIAAVPVALLVGIGLGSASNTAPAAVSTAAPVTVTAPAPEPMIVTVSPDVRDTNRFPEPGATVAPGPLTVFSDGIYEVGTKPGQIAPGKYKSANTGGDGAIFLKKANGDYSDAASGKGQLIITIKKTDVQAEVMGTTFTKM
jgi:hypothetical protein